MSTTSVASHHKALQQELQELIDLVGPAPLVDLLLERAFQLHATDIHLDPTRQGLRVRLRVDGLLHDILMLPQELTSQVISRLKLMAGMDITERRFAQDGHISHVTLRAQRDVRVGSCPTIYGERIVLRLMPDDTHLHHLSDLGLEAEQRAIIERALRQPHGMILSVGPVGSGKSTTMYSCLELLNSVHDSLVTIEDPVERRIDGINQIQVDPKIEFSFADALRGVLRQDPDVIMVGEIRDPETAHIAVRAGLSGVQVLSTLHAHDAPSAIDVFREFQIPSIFLADSVLAIISQRLVRKVCDQFYEEYVPDSVEASMLGLPQEQAHQTKLRRGIPHDVNFQTGYRGRTGIFEVMWCDHHIRQAILRGLSARELKELAVQQGMQTLEHSAIRKVLQGITTLEEMHRVLTVE
ncbi:MAG: hypothetical protein KatS3mg113_0715 [Planctomycetaceae bacterium]|nr:MAG: hypothetical protein KatS3mg113_0715 [Planctomycetaceae bacterium]